MSKSPDTKSKKSKTPSNKDKSPKGANKAASAKTKAGTTEAPRDSDRRETYGQMVAQLFKEEFNKSRKLKEHGVTYQLIWK